MHARWGRFFHGPATIPENQTAEIKGKSLIARHHWLISGLVVAILLMAGSVGGLRSYYLNRVAPGVTVGSIQIGGLTPDQAKATLNSLTAKLEINVTGGKAPQKLKPAQLGYQFDIDKTVARANGLNKGLWKIPYLKSTSIPLQFTFDKAAFDKFMVSASQVSQGPQDATVEIKDGTVTINPEKPGQAFGLDPVAAKKLLDTSLSASQNATLQVKTFTSQPNIKASMLADAKTQAEKMIKTPVTIDINGTKIVPTGQIIGTWLAVSPQKNGASISADPVRVTAYLDAVAKPYVKPPRPKVVMQNTDGTSRTLSEGAPGIDIINKDGSAKEIADAVNKQQSLVKPLAIAFAEPKTITAGDYDKWIEVDLTNKRMYAYEHGTVVREFLVSAGAPATPTVKGQYTIYAKFRRQDMRGFNANGTRYFQPNVEYINYFYQDYAIHGNYWRPTSWFGNINSSHGCVGVVNSDASWIYGWAPIGTTVITHV